MISKNSLIALLISVALYNFPILAIDSEPSREEPKQTEVNNGVQTEEVIADYKAYVAGVKPATRDEIIAYRKEIAKINKQKRELYQKLSEEGQKYLAKEQEYRKKLPLKQKKLINIQNPGTKPNEVE